MDACQQGSEPIDATGGEVVPMTADVDRRRGIAHFQLHGDFTFPSRKSLLLAYRPLLEDDAVCVLHIDLAAVTAIDNAALGMLMLLQDRIGKARKWLVLSNAKGCVQALFAVADMSRRMVILPPGARLEDLWEKPGSR